MVPLITAPDGNCFYNAVKVLMPKFEASPAELLVRANVELVVKLKDYQQTYPHCTDFIDPFRQYQRTEMIYDKKDSTLWEILALCNILQCSIRSVYPKINEDTDEAGMSYLLNKTFHPFSTTNSTKPTSTITLMWTHTAEKGTVRTVNYGMWVPNHFVPLVYYYDTKSSFTSERHPTLSKTNKLSSHVQARESKVNVCEMPAKRSRLQTDIFSGVIKEDTGERTLRINIENFIKKDNTLKDNTVIEEIVRKSLDRLKKSSQVRDKEILKKEVRKKLNNLISHKNAYARKHHQKQSASWPQYYIEVKVLVEPFGHSVVVNEDEADEALKFSPHATSSSTTTTATKKASPPIQFSGIQFRGRHDQKYIANTDLRPRIPAVHFNVASSPSPLSLSPRVSSVDENLKIIFNQATKLVAYQSNFNPHDDDDDDDDIQQKSTGNVNVSNKQKIASTSTLRKDVSGSIDFSDSDGESEYDEDYLSNREILVKRLSNTFAKMALSWKMQFSITNRAYVSLIELIQKLGRSLPQFKVVNKLKQTIKGQIPLQECKYGWYLHVFHAALAG
ncbi:unnamed protein product [Didymodactylos carnosus]|uniref:OTU domain-containing protein n=3 Tax=Didymodactylos carnosus TaxID=1234261 RepID=A0A8S2E7A7_9BILA|nr:unnamed protein product [Didymodactylos carnosus]CAF3959953.1 unnamed protein product [Didymodactylos carnosus]